MHCPPLHPACKIFPPLGQDDLQELADDIAANGLRNPIVMLDGKLLDGRNRWEACSLAKVEPRFTEFQGDDPIGWVVSQNLVRRHLTASQRAVVAFDLLPLLEKEAKGRQRRSNSYRGSGRLAPCGANRDRKGKASELAARIAKSSSRHVERVKAISKRAPDLIDEIRSGRVNVSDAERLAYLPNAQRARLLEQSNGNGEVCWKTEPPEKKAPATERTASQRKARLAATTLVCGDCRKELSKLRDRSVDLVLTDPVYPEVRPRGNDYPRVKEADWIAMMQEVVVQCRRILKPQGSAIFILQPNARKFGEMRLWLWEFVAWAGKAWNLVEDAYWWNFMALPVRGARRDAGFLRPSVKMCVWLGPPDCYRNQSAVLWTPAQAAIAERRHEMAMRLSPSGRTAKPRTLRRAVEERGGVTPYNLIPVHHTNDPLCEDHPATTPYDLAAWWCRYLLPPDGVLCDPFCGTGTMLQAGLDCGASQVIGIDKVQKYLDTAKRRVRNS
jgi:DNA modification methylase